MANCDCCTKEQKCQLSGKCERPNFNPTDCTLWNLWVSYPFPLLYKLKQKGMIKIGNNHLTPRGQKYLITKGWGLKDNVSMTLQVIFLLHTLFRFTRIDPRMIKRTVIELKEEMSKCEE